MIYNKLMDGIEDDIMKIFEAPKFEFPEDYEFIILDEELERNARLQKINQETNMLYEMFKDLQELVNVQQYSINLIADNIESSVHKVNQSEMTLIEAEEIQKSNAKQYALISSLLIAGISTPVGVTMGLKAGLGTAGGLGFGSVLYKYR